MMCNTFNELLNQGINNILNNNNITGVEEHTVNSKDLLELNKYMYTTYSTNEEDHYYSVEGIIPLHIFKLIEKKLDHYLYIAALLSENDVKIIGKNLVKISECDLSKVNELHADAYNSSDSYIEKCVYNFNKSIKNNIKYKNINTIRLYETSSLLPIDNEDGTLLNTGYCIMKPSNEAVDIMSPDLLNKQMVSIIIEDPVRSRTSLYKNITNLLKMYSYDYENVYKKRTKKISKKLKKHLKKYL